MSNAFGTRCVMCHFEEASLCATVRVPLARRPIIIAPQCNSPTTTVYRCHFRVLLSLLETACRHSTGRSACPHHIPLLSMFYRVFYYRHSALHQLSTSACTPFILLSAHNLATRCAQGCARPHRGGGGGGNSWHVHVLCTRHSTCPHYYLPPLSVCMSFILFSAPDPATHSSRRAVLDLAVEGADCLLSVVAVDTVEDVLASSVRLLEVGTVHMYLYMYVRICL